MADKQQSHAFVGNGKVYFTPVKGGVEGKPFWVGVANAAAFSHAVENESELKEYHSGKNQTWDKLDGDKSTTFSITLNERRPEAMQAALQAKVTEVATGTVAAEEHEVDAIGDIIFLKHKNVSDVVITDSTDTPLDLIENTDYTIDEKYGTIEMTHVQTITSPIKVDYSYGTATVMKPMTDDVDYYRIRVDGLNKVGQKDKQVVTAYRAKLSPADTLDLISDDFAEMTLEADLLYDEAENATYEIVKL
ncbi:hypothetical protein [Psychrobacter aquimaris]|uniref:phage tail tube protein n=1 Tax=Psychrobacter aquimaris TaxID=292733 RepID=UPI0039C6A3C3